MTKELILLADITDLGLEGDIVKVADGYARNHLIPHKLAVPVNKAAFRRLEKSKQEREARQKNDIDTAQELGAKLEQVSCTITVKVGENDKIFGSIHTNDIVKAFQEQGFELDRHNLQLDQPIRELGVYTVKIKLHPQVEASLKVWIVGE